MIYSSNNLDKETNIHNPEKIEEYLTTQLEGLKIDHPLVKDVCGEGLSKTLCLWDEFEGKPSLYSTILKKKLLSRNVLAEINNYAVKLALPPTTTISEIDKIIHSIDLTLWEIEGTLGIFRFA